MDGEGTILFLKGTLAGTLVTLGNIYASNTDQIYFLENCMMELAAFAERVLIVGGTST